MKCRYTAGNPCKHGGARVRWNRFGDPRSRIVSGRAGLDRGGSRHPGRRARRLVVGVGRRAAGPTGSRARRGRRRRAGRPVGVDDGRPPPRAGFRRARCPRDESRVHRGRHAEGPRRTGGRAGRDPGAGRHPGGRGGKPGASREAGRAADLFRARQRPGAPLRSLPAPGGQDPGLHRSARPSADAAHPRDGGGPGRPGDRTGDAPQRGPRLRRLDRSRLRPRPRGARQRGGVRGLPRGGLRSCDLGGRRRAAAAQFVPRDARRGPEPFVVASRARDPRGRGPVLGGPDRLCLPRLRGRRRRGDRQAGGAATPRRRALRVDVGGTDLGVHLGCRRGDHVHRHGRNGSRRRGGPSSVPGVELRADLPATGLGRAGTARPSPAGRAGRDVRGTPRNCCRTLGRGTSPSRHQKRCVPPSNTSPE